MTKQCLYWLAQLCDKESRYTALSSVDCKQSLSRMSRGHVKKLERKSAQSWLSIKGLLAVYLLRRGLLRAQADRSKELERAGEITKNAEDFWLFAPFLWRSMCRGKRVHNEAVGFLDAILFTGYDYSSLNILFNIISRQVKTNYKIEQRFGVVMTPFSNFKMITVNRQK